MALILHKATICTVKWKYQNPKPPYVHTMKMKFLKTIKEAINKNTFIAQKLKINEGTRSQAISVCHHTQQKEKKEKKKPCPESIPHGGRLHFFIDQDKQNCTLIVLTPDINQDGKARSTDCREGAGLALQF